MSNETTIDGETGCPEDEDACKCGGCIWNKDENEGDGKCVKDTKNMCPASVKVDDIGCPRDMQSCDGCNGCKWAREDGGNCWIDGKKRLADMDEDEEMRGKVYEIENDMEGLIYWGAAELALGFDIIFGVHFKIAGHFKDVVWGTNRAGVPIIINEIALFLGVGLTPEDQLLGVEPDPCPYLCARFGIHLDVPMLSAQALIDQELGPDDEVEGDGMNDMVEKTTTPAPNNTNATMEDSGLPAEEEEERAAGGGCSQDSKQSCFKVSIAAFPGDELQVTVGGDSKFTFDLAGLKLTVVIHFASTFRNLAVPVAQKDVYAMLDVVIPFDWSGISLLIWAKKIGVVCCGDPTDDEFGMSDPVLRIPEVGLYVEVGEVSATVENAPPRQEPSLTNKLKEEIKKKKEEIEQQVEEAKQEIEKIKDDLTGKSGDKKGPSPPPAPKPAKKTSGRKNSKKKSPLGGKKATPWRLCLWGEIQFFGKGYDYHEPKLFLPEGDDHSSSPTPSPTPSPN